MPAIGNCWLYVSQTVQVKIRNFGKIGDVLAGVVQNGSNNVSQLAFVIDDPSQVQGEAREEAIRKAKEKAMAIARAGGFALGRLLSIEEPDFGFPRYYGVGGDFGAVSKAESLPPPTIEPGSQEVMINVVLRYEIK